MKIRLTSIPREGINLEDTISLEALNKRMQEGQHNDIKFVEAPRLKVTCRLERDDCQSGATITGEVSSSYLQPCPRCLAPLKKSLRQPVNLTFKPKPAHASDSEPEDDIGLIWFEGEFIDLEEAAQEALILGISQFGGEHEDCSGIPTAELDSDVGTTNNLGELLKGAGIGAKKH